MFSKEERKLLLSPPLRPSCMSCLSVLFSFAPETPRHTLIVYEWNVYNSSKLQSTKVIIHPTFLTIMMEWRTILLALAAPLLVYQSNTCTAASSNHQAHLRIAAPLEGRIISIEEFGGKSRSIVENDTYIILRCLF
jgi:hypothetical protein